MQYALRSLQLLLIPFLLLTTACATQGTVLENTGVPEYRENRAKDFGDIVTLTYGAGAGARAQVGSFQTPLVLFHTDCYGWRYGDVIAPKHSGITDAGSLIIVFGGHNETGEERGKDFQADGGWLAAAFDHGPRIPILSKIPFLTLPLLPFMSKVHEGGEMRNALFHPYYTQVELIAGIVPSVRVGANPGEMLDFILGFTTIDFFDDDIASKSCLPSESDPSKQETLPQSDRLTPTYDPTGTQTDVKVSSPPSSKGFASTSGLV